MFDTSSLYFHKEVRLACLPLLQPIRKSVEEGKLDLCSAPSRQEEDKRLGSKAEGSQRNHSCRPELVDIESWAVVLGRAVGYCPVDTAYLST